ncbi:MarR family transcriptional regulator [Kocuria sediminis]|uniref:MarR family transcriptional regulator n=1 Tax=Kocuria sediminis TaxID=1038857 RepID=A0A6N8GPY3_9MICC|nr:MarR family transcriptional regulator [Kocuria sediminis]MUN64232.1 MarR family transcriptional regulator [Kocuria sediminis]
MPTPTTSSGYWYGDGAPRAAVEVLEALRAYRAAETAMRRRTRDEMGMGETDLLALRHLLEAARSGRTVSPRDLAARLGISSASTTTLLDRLTKSGHVRREPHPTDRRALIVTATESADREVRATLAAVHERMMAAAQSLTPEQAEVVAGFLHRMRDAVDGGGPSGG